MDPKQIEKLNQPAIFPESPAEVEIIQTHLSVVCLAGERVYKLKKSIELPFADFTTLEKRRAFCEQEFALNRRLCPDVYLEVAALVRETNGPGLRMVCEGDRAAEGEVVDYAVRMVRLPAERMLDVVLARDEVSSGEIREIASRMVDFHREARRDEEVEELGSPEKLRGFARDNFEETRAMSGRLFDERLHRALERRTDRDFEDHGELLRQRAREGEVVDGHGDLHARNICLTKPVAIYDCIEFEPAFRCGDVATDHAFLVMDLRVRGHAGLSRHYLESVVSEAGDEDLRRIISMMVRYRAMVRAKVAAITADEEEIPEEKRRESSESAQRYFRFAAATAVEEEGPLWIAFCGLPATGKSTLAEALVEISGGAWPRHASDLIRKELAGVSPREALPSTCYTAEFSRRTYDELYRLGRDDLKTHRVVVLDANFRSRFERGRLREAAGECGARLVVVESDASDDLIRARLRERAGQADSVSDADLEVYEKLKESYEPPVDGEADEVIRVEAGKDPGKLIDEILAHLL